MNLSKLEQTTPEQTNSDNQTSNYKGLVTGLILAGGQSTRMGTDKAQVIINNKPLIEWAIENLSPQVKECWISTNHPEHFKIWEKRMVIDQPPYHQQGPLSGIYAALKEIQTPWLALVPIDSPWLPPQFIQKQMQQLNTIINHTELTQIQAILLENENKHIEPLFSLIHRNSLEKLNEYLSSLPKYSCNRFLLSVPHIITKWHDDLCFRYNLNTPRDILTLDTQNPWPLYSKPLENLLTK